MLRTLQIALCSATMMVAACKKADKPAPTAPEMAKADPAKPAVPSAPAADKPADKPADPTAAAGSGSTMTKPDNAAPVPTGTNTELENKGIAMMLKMADMFAADGKDCDKLATDIKDFIGKNKPLLSELTAMEKKQSPQEREGFAARNKAIEQTVMQKMTPAMTACRDNKNVEAAMKEFPTD